MVAGPLELFTASSPADCEHKRTTTKKLHSESKSNESTATWATNRTFGTYFSAKLNGKRSVTEPSPDALFLKAKKPVSVISRALTASATLNVGNSTYTVLPPVNIRMNVSPLTESDSSVGRKSISGVRGPGFISGWGRGRGRLRGFTAQPFAGPPKWEDPLSHDGSGWERPIEYEGRKFQISES
eukprot:CAMPEP_0198230256 /NCGR_PEP_ID=MMETSP1445-20131203/114569_1 /TAXON_ID=36898 /ORGANISM="Pyramimonas sp., Strain CCMP2087" /LENGTH=183 /DNA_ID=CAMNT_0043910785 /DNA_START=126 /DNA_END=678 /DNA_ORIENTATION=+